MRYNKIREMDISNGPGCRVSIFEQGCSFNCKGCFNPETHDFMGGEEFNDETIDKIMKLFDGIEGSQRQGLSVLGGEPMHPSNIEGTTKLIKTFKEKYPEKNVWVWSGFSFDDYLKDKEVINYVDVLVDGQFKEELHNPTLKWRGSSNQRVIDVKTSLKNGKTTLYTS